MPSYKYKAKTKAGATISETESVQSLAHLKQKLRAEGSILINYEEVEAPVPKDKKIPDQVLIDFTNSLVFNLRAGMGVRDVLVQYGADTENKYLAKFLPHIVREMESGETLGHALSKFKKAVPKLYSSIVIIGEESGELEANLLYLAKYIKWESQLKNDIKGILKGPIGILLAVCAVSYVMLTNVFPVFMSIVDENTELPAISVFVIDLSDILQHHGTAVLMGIVSVIAAYKIAKAKSEKFRYAIDKFLLRAPIIGKCTSMILQSRVANNMILMYTSGVPIIKILDETSKSVGNRVMADALIYVRDEAKSGNSLTDSFRATGMFSPIFLNMMRVGESTGSLADALKNVTEYYDYELPIVVSSLKGILQTVLTLFSVSVVGILMGAFFLLMWSAVGSIG